MNKDRFIECFDTVLNMCEAKDEETFETFKSTAKELVVQAINLYEAKSLFDSACLNTSLESIAQKFNNEVCNINDW